MLAIFNMGVPATLRVLLFTIDIGSAVDPLHCTTVPFSLAVAVTVRLEVISATGPVAVVMRLVVSVKVATKVMSLHCGGVTPLQSTLLPMGVVSSTNWMGSLPMMNGSTIHSRANPCVTVQL